MAFKTFSHLEAILVFWGNSWLLGPFWAPRAKILGSGGLCGPSWAFGGYFTITPTPTPTPTPGPESHQNKLAPGKIQNLIQEVVGPSLLG